MNNIIIKIGSAITKYILSAFNPDYLDSVFGGTIDIDDLVDQVILECIKKAFDSTEEKHSLRYYLKINGDGFSDDIRMRYSRLMAIVNEAKKNEVEFIKLFGVDVDAESVLKSMNNFSDKIDGYELSEMNFFEINNLGDLDLIKAIINHRMSDVHKIDNTRFKEIAAQYDKRILSWKELAQNDDRSMVFFSLAYFTIEWKYAFNFLYECALVMEKYPELCENEVLSKINMLFGYKDFMTEIGHVTTDSRMVGYREKLVEDFFSFQELRYQYSELLGLVTLLKEKTLIENEPVEKWFIENTNINDWASFFREYDVFKYATFEKNWSNKRIRAVRKLMNSVFPKNPENRSYKIEEDFDTLMMTILKEGSELDKLECYIEEYLNDNKQLCARIRDKKSGKKVEMIGEYFVKNHFLRFLSQAKININIMPTVFEADGVDVVAVRGIKRNEDDTSIVIELTGLGAGYLFE